MRSRFIVRPCDAKGVWIRWPWDYDSVMDESKANFFKEQLPFTAGIAATLFVAVRIFSAAAYNPTTAYGILQAEGTGTVIIGSLMPSLGIIPVALTSFLINYYDKLPKDEQGSFRSAYVGALAFLLVIGIFITPIAGLVLMIIFDAFQIWIRGEWKRNVKKDLEARKKLPAELQFELDRAIKKLSWQAGRRKGGLSVSTALVAVVFLLQSVNSPPWLPTEKIDVRGSSPLVGWVLSNSDTFTSVLTLSGRIEYVTTSSIAGREICIAFSQAPITKTIPEVTVHSPYPAC